MISGMAVGVFVDKAHRPTDMEIRESIGHKHALWEELLQFIADHYAVRKDFAFYGKNYGWALRLRKGGKALLSIYPQKEFFIAQIVLSQSHTDATADLHLGRKVRGLLRERVNFPKGAGSSSKYDPNRILPTSSGCSVSRHHLKLDSARSSNGK